MADEVDSKYEAFVADVRPTFGGAAQQQRKDWAMSEGNRDLEHWTPETEKHWRRGMERIVAYESDQDALIADLRSATADLQSQLEAAQQERTDWSNKAIEALHRRDATANQLEAERTKREEAEGRVDLLTMNLQVVG